MIRASDLAGIEPGRTLRDAERIARRQARSGSGWVHRRLLAEIDRLRRQREADAEIVRTASRYVHGEADLLALIAAVDARKAAQQ